MRRMLAPLFAAVALAGVLAAPPAAAESSSPPPCTDIIAGSGFYRDGTLTFRVTLQAPSCPSVTYKLYLYHSKGDPEPFVRSAQQGNGSTQLFYTVPAADPDKTICLAGATYKSVLHFFDRAPDSSCIAVGGDGTGALPFH